MSEHVAPPGKDGRFSNIHANTSFDCLIAKMSKDTKCKKSGSLRPGSKFAKMKIQRECAYII